MPHVTRYYLQLQIIKRTAILQLIIFFQFKILIYQFSLYFVIKG